MAQYTYERPREKIQSRGARYLSMAELFQLVIGSGGSNISGAKISRNIANIAHKSDEITLNQLVKVPGVGLAKACQILAAIELGRRIELSAKNKPNGGSKLLKAAIAELAQAVRASKSAEIGCVWLDGASQVIDYKIYKLSNQKHPSLVAQIVLKDAYLAASRSVGMILKVSKGNLMPSVAQLSFIQHLLDTAKVLQIQIYEIIADDGQNSASWSKSL